ncbi:hypothetical protein LCGC14_2717600 [marine sediment metagenome]|uniref:Uncharacterized protein n=1 Tax=marine sediment metagenome TaxID=412755 RepID=A0A0F8ZYP7_9ZZZZ
MRKSKKVSPKGPVVTVEKSGAGSKVGVELVEAVSAGETVAPTLIPQKHGGSLLSGGTPGNKGGGRTASELRGLMRRPLAKLLPVVERIAEATDTQEVTCPECDHKHQVTSWLKASDKLKAVDLLARYGIGTQQEVDHGGHITLHACQSDRE